MAIDPLTGKEIVRTVHVDDPAASLVEPVVEVIDPPRPAALPADPDADDGGTAGGDDRGNITELRAKPSLHDLERSAIGDRYSAKRAAELGLTTEAPPAPIVEPPAPAVIDPAAPAPRITESPAPAAKTYEIVVNGQKVLMAEADVVKAATEAMATGVTLEEAKRLRDTAAARAAETATPAQPSRGEAGRTTDRQNDPARRVPDPARLATIVERLQVGTPEEGAQALADLLAEAVPPTPQNDGATVTTAVETVLNRRSASKEAETALAGFKTKFPALADDDDFSTMVIRRTSDEILADFKRIGVPESDIAAARKDPAVLIEGYRNLRTQVNPTTGRPWDLRSYDQILDAAGTAVASKVGVKVASVPGVEQPGKVTVSPARAAAKAVLTQQPRSAGLPADAGRSGNPSQTPPARSRGSDIVAEQRRARGFV